MTSIKHTYHNIADIISFDSDLATLSTSLSKPNFDWDALVKIGSAHLLLPTLYFRLRAKNLLRLLPEDLAAYLGEIALLNRERNLAILNQVEAIASMLEAHNIDYVFLKGAALLVCANYSDLGERMLGDIDLLVADSQSETAYDLFLKNGYRVSENRKFSKHRHLPRLIPTESIAAVEVHLQLFNKYEIKALVPDEVLQKKVRKNEVNIPSEEKLLLHAVLGWQINDGGHRYNKVCLRSAYDGLVLEQKLPGILKKVSKTNRLTKKNSVFLNLFFEEYSNFKGFGLLSFFYSYKFKSIIFRNLWEMLLYMYYDFYREKIKIPRQLLLSIRRILRKV